MSRSFPDRLSSVLDFAKRQEYGRIWSKKCAGRTFVYYLHYLFCKHSISLSKSVVVAKSPGNSFVMWEEEVHGIVGFGVILFAPVYNATICVLYYLAYSEHITVNIH